MLVTIDARVSGQHVGRQIVCLADPADRAQDIGKADGCGECVWRAAAEKPGSALEEILG